MEEHNSVEFTLYSPLSPPELLEHIRANTYSCYIAASFGTLKNADYTFIVQSESDNEIILQPVGFLRNSEQPNLLLKLYQREIGEGTDIESLCPQTKDNLAGPYRLPCGAPVRRTDSFSGNSADPDWVACPHHLSRNCGKRNTTTQRIADRTPENQIMITRKK
ncbi:hypothetical protein [Victivallis vadensis]|uniref:hypothetical protein n=1 Tax=Victivallis vadensis TaxID=172901 RepID=UPI0026DAE3C9|nr:hypothetical protein [Victivallis vadensis]